MTQPILSTRSITKRFGGITALEDVSIDLFPGKVNAIVGENGAGKSTLMKILAGVYQGFEGELLLDNRQVVFSNPADATKHGVAIIHQELSLIPVLTVTENFFLGREMVNSLGLLDTTEMNLQTARSLRKVGCELDPQTPVSALRVGERQLVEIARALSLQARILIMDEPTSAISKPEIERLFRLVEELQGKGVAIVYISHKLEELLHIADRFVALRDGRLAGVVEDGRNTSQAELVAMMVGREKGTDFRRRAHEPGREVLNVQQMCLRHPAMAGRHLFHDVNFTVRSREVLGIFGLMGAGRTELLEALFGLHAPLATGTVSIDEEVVSIRSIDDAIAAGMALVPEDRKRDGLVLEMTIAENISLASLNALLTRGLLDRKKEADMARHQVAQLHIKARDVGQKTSDLSGGNQQKVVVGKWLARNPKVLFLDEPTRGVDVGAKSEIYQVIDELARQGMAVVVVSSELPEVFAISDRIMVMCESRVTAIFDTSAVDEQSVLQAAFPKSIPQETDNPA